MFAELVVNVSAPLESTFHYHVPSDLRSVLEEGHLVEVEFGRRLAQGIVVAFAETAPVEDTKPVIALVMDEPVVLSWQIELARWLSEQYLAPLNGCLRLMLPPGLTRWSDVTLDINPYWDGSGRLTAAQEALIELLRERGDLRGRQVARALKLGSGWKNAANQLAQRGILRKGSVLEPPRIRPKEIRTAELAASWDRVRKAVRELGRSSKMADVLEYLELCEDPLPAEATVQEATGADEKHLRQLEEVQLVTRTAPRQLFVSLVAPEQAPVKWQEILEGLPAAVDEVQLPLDDPQAEALVAVVDEPARIALGIRPRDVLAHVLRYRQAETYYRILAFLAEEAEAVPIGDVYAATGANLKHLRRLAKLDVVRLGSHEVWRDPLAEREFVPVEPPRLTEDQARVWGRVKMWMLAGEESVLGPADDGTVWRPFLLHGVTGSGKTEIYMRAIELALARGQQAIVLVPEIALTPQTVRRFSARFTGRVAVMHSGLSDGERYDTWRRARQGLFDIVVGPRSALFTPFDNLGVIVVDEEHDASYKQTPPVPPPYYHARETAIEAGRLTGAAVILGSATPDVVTYHRAQGGSLQLLELPKRVMGHRQRVEQQMVRHQLPSRYHQLAGEPEEALSIDLPPVQVVDLRQELRAGNRSIFSRALEAAVNHTLARGEQAILFLNRRGTKTFIMCRDCGHIMSCPRCDMPLTYHRPHLALACHYCGRRENLPEQCPQCGSKRIKYFGLGTEEVEAQVQQRWPQARITRWDRDTTAGRDSHDTILASFVNRQADILVGTQMIAKGLDLPFVTLVGVISADVSLGLPDFHTGERAFQILAQVAGRAGRGLLGGRVIFQTYQPEHYAIQAAADHDYASFYLDEIRFRTQHMLPPFRRMAKLVIVDPVNQRGQHQAEELAEALRSHVRERNLKSTEVYGPVPPFFNRIDGRYRWQIILRTPDPRRVLADFHIPRPWILDIDPVSTL